MELFLLFLLAVFVFGLVTTLITKYLRLPAPDEEVEQLLLWGGLLLSAAILAILSFYLLSHP